VQGLMVVHCLQAAAARKTGVSVATHRDVFGPAGGPACLSNKHHIVCCVRADDGAACTAAPATARHQGLLLGAFKGVGGFHREGAAGSARIHLQHATSCSTGLQHEDVRHMQQVRTQVLSR
jgi:hypothetical protein